MELNDLKKLFYKTGQTARLMSVRKDGIIYQTVIKGGKIVSFTVPLNEIGETIWEELIPAKLLIRYINEVD